MRAFGSGGSFANPSARSVFRPVLRARGCAHGAVAALALWLATIAWAWAGAGEPIVPTDLLRLRTIPAIDVARDGRAAVWVVRSCTPPAWSGDEAKYEYRSHLWFVDLFSEPHAPRQMTFGAAIDTSPVLSPAGTHVAFIRAAAPGAPGQVHVLDLAGGEARPVTALPRGASAPRWSPDGRLIAFVSSVPLSEMPSAPPWPLERPRRTWNDEPHTGTADAPEPQAPFPDGPRQSRRDWLAQNASMGNPAVITRLDFIDDRGLRAALSFDQVFVVEPIDDPKPRRITTAFADHADPVFDREGTRVIFTTVRTGTAHPDRVLHSELWSVGIDGVDERVVIAQDGWTFADPQPTRDGSAVAFRCRPIDEPAYRQWMLGLVALERSADRVDGRAGSSEKIIITEALDRSVTRFVLHGPDGLLFTVPDRGGFPLLAASPARQEPTDLVRTSGGMPVGIYAFGAGGGAVVYAQTTPAVPCELRVRDARGDRQLMDLNPWVRDRAVSLPQERWIVRPDGTRVQLWIMEPRRTRPGEQAPLLLKIHGGPNAMWGPGELTMWHELQMYCSSGFGVVYANPRGSGGYGYAFERGNRQDWGSGPAGDVLAAVDAALALSWVDRERLVVTGGSYGGFLTAWILTRDARFKAAVADRGVYHMDTFFGEGSAWRLVERSFGGNPYDLRVRDVLERHSPVIDARRIRTPVLIMQGDRDRRTGYVQSEMLYRALKSLDRPVEYVRYPDADHDMSRRGPLRQRIDRLVRSMEFFDRYVGP